MGNGYGSYHCTLEEDLHVYDDLPPPVRDLFKYSVGDWAAPGILRNLKDGFAHTRSRATAIELVDRMIRRSEPEECYRTYGPDHPQANSHGRKLRADHHQLWGRRA